MRPSKRDEIVERALAVFAEEGYGRAGMDALAARIGVSKSSIYNHFESKDALILAALAVQEARIDALVSARVAAAEGPRDALLAVFDALGIWFASPGFRGCLFQRAAAEFQAAESPVRAAALARKRAFAGRLNDLAEAAGAPGAGPAVHALAEGAILRAAFGLTTEAAAEARRAAETLIAAEAPARRSPEAPPPARGLRAP
ncbi:MAG: TetR/AcrR family transcriptional regulator [Pikeienuella sp.]|uniref:TetR/AcrR family transcriptional regulator n=1 Tax=Pikeienuella sp. TaxID=2831957 RepID=UPI003919F713